MMKGKILVIISALVLVSCRTNPNSKNDLNYLQYIEKVAIESSAKNSVNTIQKGDQLVILITAKDMAVVKPFNQNYSSSEVIQSNATAGGNNPNQGATNVSGPTYIVDSDGNIDFPVLGVINAGGKTLVELKDDLRERIQQFCRNASCAGTLWNDHWRICPND
mgnify:CR=1 FL=1